MRSVQDLLAWIGSRGGAAHSAALVGAGFTVHAMRTAVERGAVDRVRRSWLVLPDCDVRLRNAARLGARSTCLSEAERLRLWTPSHAELHLSVAPTSSRRDAAGVTLHWSPGPSPVAKTALQEPVLNVLHHIAGCVPPADALAVWESAIRTKLVDAAVIERVRWSGTIARRLAANASHLSDSGIETRFVVLMGSIGVSVRQQVWIDGHPVDGLIGEHLVVQLDGFAHHRAEQRRRDLRADARLVLRGYTVLRFDYVQVLLTPDEVIGTISAALAQGLHR